MRVAPRPGLESFCHCIGLPRCCRESLVLHASQLEPSASDSELVSCNWILCSWAPVRISLCTGKTQGLLSGSISPWPSRVTCHDLSESSDPRSAGVCCWNRCHECFELDSERGEAAAMGLGMWWWRDKRW